MNKHLFSLSLAFGTAATSVGLMAVGAPAAVVLPGIPLAMVAMNYFGDLLGGKEQGFNGTTYVAGTALSLGLGAMTLEATSPGSVERYLSSPASNEQSEMSTPEPLGLS